jgi:hypothetical protein
MPPVLRQGGLSFRIYLNDHPPPHVHVVSQEGTAKIAIGDVNTEPYLLEVEGMTRKDVARALRAVGDYQQEFLHRWSEIHG